MKGTGISLLIPLLLTVQAAGWLREDGSSWDRPIDILTGPNGGLFITDDSGGVICRVIYGQQKPILSIQEENNEPKPLRQEKI